MHTEFKGMGYPSHQMNSYGSQIEKIASWLEEYFNVESISEDKVGELAIHLLTGMNLVNQEYEQSIRSQREDDAKSYQIVIKIYPQGISLIRGTEGDITVVEGDLEDTVEKIRALANTIRVSLGKPKQAVEAPIGEKEGTE